MDQRKFKRIDVRIPVHCTLCNQEGEKHSVCGLAYDLSLSGLKIKVPIPSHWQSLAGLHYHLELPPPFVAITGQGNIQWAKRDVGSSIILGVEFGDLTSEQWSDLLQLVLELNRP